MSQSERSAKKWSLYVRRRTSRDNGSGDVLAVIYPGGPKTEEVSLRTAKLRIIFRISRYPLTYPSYMMGKDVSLPFSHMFDDFYASSEF